MRRDSIEPVTRLRNVGPKTSAMLAHAGIRSAAELRRIGAVAAFVRLKQGWPGTSANALYALAGAIEDTDWRDVRRACRLELLTAVEDFQRAEVHRAPRTQRAKHQGTHDELRTLRNIGPAMRRDFDLLGIRTRAQLARCTADALYRRLAQRTGTWHDPCVWDTLAAAIHQARTGEALPWWHFTRERKAREAEGTFVRARPRRKRDAAR